MTLATATIQGVAYPEGSRYGRDTQFAPAVPADVQVNACLYPYSDPPRAKSVTCRGTASASGVFGSAQGVQPFVLDSPGEYHAHVPAAYVDAEGRLWVCSMRHAGVLYSDDGRVMAHGKKRTIEGKYADRGETLLEGYVDSEGNNHLAHLNFPDRAGDVLSIASERQGADKIEPVLTYDWKDRPLPYDPRWQNIAARNLRLCTSNGLSPPALKVRKQPCDRAGRGGCAGTARRPGTLLPRRHAAGDDLRDGFGLGAGGADRSHSAGQDHLRPEYPDGRRKVWQGAGDRFGAFAGADKAILDVPGVYGFWMEADWEGHKGYMPGLPSGGGDIYVVERVRPANAPRLKLDFAGQTAFPAAYGIRIGGSSTVRTVRCAAVIRGAVIEQGSLEVRDGRFGYFFDPGRFHSITPTYDNVNLVTGKPEIGDVVNLRFCSG